MVNESLPSLKITPPRLWPSPAEVHGSCHASLQDIEPPPRTMVDPSISWHPRIAHSALSVDRPTRDPREHSPAYPSMLTQHGGGVGLRVSAGHFWAARGRISRRNQVCLYFDLNLVPRACCACCRSGCRSGVQRIQGGKGSQCDSFPGSLGGIL